MSNIKVVLTQGESLKMISRGVSKLIMGWLWLNYFQPFYTPPGRDCKCKAVLRE